MEENAKAEFREKVWRLVHGIPPGKVCTYRQIAGLADHPGHARLVGKILSQLPSGSQLPWHRVLNAKGKLTSPGKAIQQQLLADEGVVVLNGHVNLNSYQWDTR